MVTIDAAGVLMEPDFHDGYLTGISLADHHELWLMCQTASGEKFTLLMPDLVHLRADNFLAGNIIFEIVIREGKACKIESLKKLWNYTEAQAREHVPKQIKEIADNSWTMLELSTSYGCDLIALSRNRASSIKIHPAS